MTDPLKLAAEVEAGCGLTYPEMRLVAAALRLAERASVTDPVIESGDSFMCRWCGVPERRVTFRPDFRHRSDCMWAAYRAAKEGS